MTAYRGIERLRRSLYAVAASLLMGLTFVGAGSGPASAASAVASGGGSGYGYCYGLRSARGAARCAISRCQRRARRRCSVIVACNHGGFGVIYMRRLRNGWIEAIGASCGARTVHAARRIASRACNRRARTNRCAGPKVGWRDRRR